MMPKLRYVTLRRQIGSDDGFIATMHRPGLSDGTL